MLADRGRHRPAQSVSLPVSSQEEENDPSPKKHPKNTGGGRRDEGVSSERSPWACPTASRQRQSKTPEMCSYHKIKALSGNKFILWSVLAPPQI